MGTISVPATPMTSKTPTTVQATGRRRRGAGCVIASSRCVGPRPRSRGTYLDNGPVNGGMQRIAAPAISRREVVSVSPVLEGTVALVTAASSGIGAATAETLAAHGAAVALAARRRAQLEDLAAGITERGGTALVLECD